MKIDLPLETWVDVFGFVPRFQLVQLVPHIKKRYKNINYDREVSVECTTPTIGDRQFVSFIQFYLHKCGEITLGFLEVLNSPRNGHDNPIVKDFKYDPLALGGRVFPLADAPISQNIKNFEGIDFRYFDESVLHFLQAFQQHSLLTNVNLIFALRRRHRQSTDALRGIMAKMMPLLDSIDSIRIDGSVALCDILPFSPNNEYSLLAKRLLESTRFLNIGLYNQYGDCDWTCFDWYLRWLYTPNKDGMPRYLDICDYYGHCTCPLFVECVKKEFLEGNQTAISFFVYLYFENAPNVQSVTLENGKTQEKLVIRREAFGMSISRHPIGATEKWIEEMNQYFMQKNEGRRKIIIYI